MSVSCSVDCLVHQRPGSQTETIKCQVPVSDPSDANFTNTPPVVHEITLDTMGEPRNLEILRAVFHAPDKLKPGATSEAITAEAAERLGEVARSLRERGLDPPGVARYLDRIVFCMFAEDIGLLPEDLFTRMHEKAGTDPARLSKLVAADLKKRTLTALYNTRPEWLKNAHRTLDEAVFAAYGWPAGMKDEGILARLLELNIAQGLREVQSDHEN